MANKLSLYDLINKYTGQPNMLTTNMPIEQQPQQEQQITNQENIQQPTTTQYAQPTTQRPVMNQELQQEYEQSLQKPKGFMAKYGLTPGVIAQLAGGITALTGGSGYLAGGLAQAGDQARSGEAQIEAQRKASLADYVKGKQGEQSAYDIAQAKAAEAFSLKQLQTEQEREKANQQKAIKEAEMAQEKALKEAEMAQKAQLQAEQMAIEKLKLQSSNNKNTKDINDTTFQQESKLRNEYVKNLGSFPTIVESYGRIKASSKDPSAAGDLALIFNYMKMLDPGSTVREGEFANAENSAGIPERIRARYNKVMSGERLADVQRNDFVDRSNKLYSSAEEVAKNMTNIYKERAKQYGLDPNRTLVDFTYKGQKELANKVSQQQKPIQQVKSFNSPQEADKSGLPAGSIVMVNGRRYQI